MPRVKCFIKDCINWTEDGCKLDEIEINWNTCFDSEPGCMDYEEEE